MNIIIGILVLGYFILAGYTLYRGFSVKDLKDMTFNGAGDAFSLCKILMTVGIVTGIWRISGTIIAFVYYGVQIITPSLFLLIAFLITCLLSYALGTAFGVAGTAGVIFMTLARSGNVNPIITGGILLSAIYFGDRSSPISSTANMVADLTKTDLGKNVKGMMKTGALPFLACLVVYAILSFNNPLLAMNKDQINVLTDSFSVTPLAFIPAAFILFLPMLKVSVMNSLLASIISGALVAGFVQGAGPLELLRACVLGYHTADSQLGAIINGGGMISMLSTVVVVLISCSYSGIFKGTGILEEIVRHTSKLSDKIGAFPSMILVTLLSSAVFCNQIVAIVMCENTMGDYYKESGRTQNQLAMDIENTAITIPTFIPWSIMCTVPCELLNVEYSSLIFAVYLYAIPLVNWVRPLLTERIRTLTKFA